ncbi:MAG TPA: phosphoribosylamine--glycine ligase [Candidatus Saccharimonadales bacterium]|nr:phosphoribosylamine--glycine ligase [Candidatus Saccharimonadales bacterium]
MSSKKVLIVGSGAREHALAWKIAQSPKVAKLFCAPGNPGTAQIAENITIATNKTKSLLKFALSNQIDLTIVGPDEPLVQGIVDLFSKNNLKIFGPTINAAKIEWSKAFAKSFMKNYSIPTANFKVFSNEKTANEYLKTVQFPVVVKASGLALGKGVLICQTLAEAKKAVRDILVKKIFGSAGDKVVIEDFLVGQEISIHAIASGKNFLLFPTAQDHKQIYDGGKGPNTGGMGTFAPVPWMAKKLVNEINSQIVEPTLAALKKETNFFQGCLFPGLMITPEGPKVLEFNARFGDPEAQSYMRILNYDLFDLLYSCTTGELKSIKLSWKRGFAVCVVLASKGYPGDYSSGKEITGVEKAEKLEGVVVFQSGTKSENGKLLTAGGRVLSVTATGTKLEDARKRAYQAVDLINFEGKSFRTDIAGKALTLNH